MPILPTPIRSILSALAGLAAVALIALWAAGRILTDQTEWSQWAFWIPPPLIAAGALAFLLISWFLRKLGARKRGLGPLSRAIGAVGLLLMLVYTPLVEWRYWTFLGGWLLPATTGPTLKVAAWNMAWNGLEAAGPARTTMLGSLGVDLLVLSNPRADLKTAEALSAVGPGAASGRAGPFLIVSRWPVVRHGLVSLGIGGRIFQFDETDLQPGLKDHIDNGSAAFFELDTTEKLGRTIVVWAVDLPSDPFIPRREMMAKARAAIESWPGPQTRGGAREIPSTPGFPAPDLIVGDFNTPRSSGSLALLTGDLPSAYSQAGLGMDGSWPRSWPLFHIDQMFVGARLRARAYDVIDPGEASHRLQVAEIVQVK
jgi:hypothetical protein